ncbi:MAG: mannitol dehydrogenase family protein [Pseudomonadota bacterium]
MPPMPRLTRTGSAPKPGIVHFGPGAFFRAFNAIYTEDAMEATGGDWGIIAVSLRSAAARDQLEPQNGAYSSITLGEADTTVRVIGSIERVLVAPEDPSAVLGALTDPSIKVVSLTVTEKGYCHNPATGRLDLGHPDIAHDLEHSSAPCSVVGFLVAALAQRRTGGHAPFTVLSCDNLPSNGTLTRQIVLDFAEARDPELARWISEEVPFPSTMVDRITPATSPDQTERLAQSEGYFDPACVAHERFRQWVIEHTFADGRPRWETVGAQFVDSVDLHETMKLRCLNGAHSALAYLGYLAGCETIGDTVADPNFKGYCERIWQHEILPTLRQPEGEDLQAYCRSLMARFEDPAIRHRTWQIAMDGSQKLPQRLLGSVRDNLAKGILPQGLCLAVAAWIRYVGGTDENGNAIDVRDPMADRLKAAVADARSTKDAVGAVLAVRDIFDAGLAADPQFVEAVTRFYEALRRDGAKTTVGRLMAGAV